MASNPPFQPLTLYPIAPNGIFWTLQGEGALVGEPMAFVRLAGCSVGCPECDTDYRVSSRRTVEEIVYAVEAFTPESFSRPWVWITGGEPTDHNLQPLVAAFKAKSYAVALATSGVRNVGQLADWISVSPHGPELKQRSGHELKVVPGLNGMSLDACGALPLGFAYKFVQPLAGSSESMAECIEFVKTHPGWRLSQQAHKGWGLP